MNHPFKKEILSHKHFYWFLLAVVFAVSIWFFFIQTRSFLAESDELSRGLVDSVNAVKITRVTVDYGNGKKRVFEGNASEEMRLLIVFGGIEKTAGIVFGIENGRIAEVDGIINEGGRGWVYYLNGKRQEEDPALKSVMPGDEIIVKYE